MTHSARSPECLSRSSTSNCPRTGSRCGPPSRATARACSSCAPKASPSLPTPSCATCRTCCGPDDVVVVNDTRVIPARLSGVRVRGEAVARIEATLHKREGEDRWRAFVRPAKKLKLGERIRFGEASESMACLLGSLDAEVVEKGEDGEVLLAFSFTGPALDEAIARIGAHAASALHRLEACRGRKGRARLPDAVRRQAGRGRRAHGRPALHARSGEAHRGGRRLVRHRHAARRRGHVPAREGGRHERPQDACGVRRHHAGDRRQAQRRARKGRAHPRRRHHEPAHPRDRSGRATARSSRSRATPRSSSRPATGSGPSTCC